MKKKITMSLLIFLGLAFSLLAQDTEVKSIMTKNYDKSTNLVYWPDEFNPEKAKWYVYNEIKINAQPELVWDILIDATQWHTFYKGYKALLYF